MRARDWIPEELRSEVVDKIQIIRGNPNPPKKVIGGLIDMYNKYYNPNPVKCVKCKNDRKYVMTQLSACVMLWKKHEESLRK